MNDAEKKLFLNQFTIVKLRAVCIAVGVISTGKKDDVIQRLCEFQNFNKVKKCATKDIEQIKNMSETKTKNKVVKDPTTSETKTKIAKDPTTSETKTKIAKDPIISETKTKTKVAKRSNYIRN